jgi:adenylate cyclase
MAVEIERKFLVISDAWREVVSRSERMAQGYLAGPPASRCSVRIRIGGEAAFLNIKSIAVGIERDEYEYQIPRDDGERMLATLAGERVEKIRSYVELDRHLFEIDEFLGESAGLIVAEIELAHADAAFPRPRWLGVEVSHLARYYNLNLAVRPYSRWTRDEREALDAGRSPKSP